MRTAEIRRRWLDYFEKNNHHIAPSVPLVSPDPSILFTVAGMVPFIPYILGTEPAPWPRAASVQKCIRTNDIDNVGKTTRHGTFFQMNGNFSFGDYFKEGAIDLAWGLLTSPVAEGGYGLDGDRLWMTIWEEDEVSYDHWTSVVGLPADHIQKLPFKDISWSTGQPGPAGSCCEIHYDRGPAYGPDGGPAADAQGDRFLEIWNLVFDEFVRGEGEGHDFELVGKLDQTAIDTGAGLERIAYLLQGKANMYEIDEVFPVIAATEEITGKKYGADAQDDVRMRVVADHVRSALMLIGDGVRPGNDGRGYVLRRLIRRAVRSVRLLGVDEAVLTGLVTVSKDAMSESYPELEADADQILQVAGEEEAAFRRTLAAGTQIFDLAASTASKGNRIVSGEDAFALHDTYGFPIDLTLEMASEQGLAVDEAEFRRLMQEQRDRARADARSKKTGHVDAAVYHGILDENGGPTRFLGYTESAAEGRIVALLVDGVPVPAATAPAEVDVILDQTPFWAEMGGQLADRGTIGVEGGGLVRVDDVQAPVKGLHVHRGTVSEGTIAVGERAFSQIDVDRRGQIARSHTSTHMIHKVLHEFLGEQATQAGSENSPSRLRFDFRHGQQVPADVVAGIEGRVNDRLRENLEVTDEVMDLEEARAAGAMALFGEKYGKRVRVVSIGGDWSKELCAGTHVGETGEIGLVSILGESSIGSGVRRVDALVGEGAYAYGAKEHALVSQLAGIVGARPDELPERIDAVLARLKSAEKEIAALRREKLSAGVGDILGGRRRVGRFDVYWAGLGEVASGDDVRTVATDVRGRIDDSDPAVVVVGGTVNGRPSVVVATTSAARQAGARAGRLVASFSKTLGGGGGGRDDIAQGGGQDPSRLLEALKTLEAELG
ncbi:alanine--tRNA ligase [Actinobaculum sp. oral taxon 183 str. F0552]|uniref:alanine--tRNA ligase n=1 Tax=Actinobaculum sp. oral taxon 183 TaxID=712888 RepID=UPI000397B4E4|nr:alanine--tRNA ligase [Actinobaculum sp. oral taxon 183]ERH19851.1 alanine--tRNA ligase [Actinobaculum sp. oral taxon 183 str. F0552]